MCRIAGIFNPQEQNLKQRIGAMRDAMQHGGPDDAGIFLHPKLPLALGHRRLSLIDLSENGHQPMHFEAAGLTIVFNGEIYNYLELKNTLQQQGYTFTTESDTEVILKAFDKWGLDSFGYLNGMFALAIWNNRNQQLVLARDHAGIKPLYYFFDETSFYFASEMRAFAHCGKRFTENEQWKSAFLMFGHLPEPITTLKNVIPLEKGTSLSIDMATFSLKKSTFFQWKQNPVIFNEKEAVEKIKTALESAVTRHMIADAPLGLFLSGGIDSSLLTLLAAKNKKQGLHALSIVFNEKEYSEEKYQQLIIEKTGAQHQSFLITENDFNAQISDVICAMDQPTLDGINTYFISRAARQYGLKAVLSGLGADELFGGYPSFKNYKTFRALNLLPNFVLKQFQYSNDYRFKKLSFAGINNTASNYLLHRGIFNPLSVASILDGTQQQIVNYLDEISSYYPNNQLQNGNLISWLETSFYMQNQLLKDSDTMSMWHGLEIRVPFLDKQLMELVGAIDPNIKFKNTLPKFLLVKSFLAELPEAIWNRKKQGFTFPFAKWLHENEMAKPANSKEHQLYTSFKNNKLSWGRYWCVLLMNRYAQKHSIAA